MIIDTDSYTDFRTIVATLSKTQPQSVFFTIAAPGKGVDTDPLFVVFCVFDDKVIRTINLGVQPSTFTSDFPSAIQLQSRLGLAA